MVIGFLRDNRLDQALKRADDAEAKVAEAQTKTAVAEALMQQERERANQYVAELERYRESYEKTTDALIQLLQERDGNHPPNSGSVE